MNVQKKLGLTEGSSDKEVGPMMTNILIWGLFMSNVTRAVIHLGHIYTENMAVSRNMFVKEIKILFSITRRLVSVNSKEILNVRVIDSKDPSWIKTKISHPQVIQWTKAKVHVHFDSVLCLGKIFALAEAAEIWKGVSNQQIYGIDGASIEYFIKKDWSRNIAPEKFGGRIIFVSLFNDVDWNKKNKEDECISNSEKVRDQVKRCSQGHWTFLGPGNEMKWFGNRFTGLRENGIPQQHGCCNDLRRQDIRFVQLSVP